MGTQPNQLNNNRSSIKQHAINHRSTPRGQTTHQTMQQPNNNCCTPYQQHVKANHQQTTTAHTNKRPTTNRSSDNQTRPSTNQHARLRANHSSINHTSTNNTQRTRGQPMRALQCSNTLAMRAHGTTNKQQICGQQLHLTNKCRKQTTTTHTTNTAPQ